MGSRSLAASFRASEEPKDGQDGEQIDRGSDGHPRVSSQNDRGHDSEEPPPRMFDDRINDEFHSVPFNRTADTRQPK